MGITINDTLDLSIGTQITGAYASFGEATITLQKIDDDSYQLRGKARLWFDEPHRRGARPEFQGETILLTLDSNQLDGNIYDLLYTSLKRLYSSTTDV